MKKFLSLVLALVMTMSLVTISAGAKDFTDDSKINYKEAVDVISALKVVEGDTAGGFNPQNGLTRGAAAKIICNLILTPTTAGALVADTAPFKDVPANSTYAGYIAYCAQQGIISGYTDGTFRPAAPLTGYAFMKMLLGVLGYDATIEGYSVPNWSIAVAKRGLSIGLDKGLSEDFDGRKNVTREEAALYALNALQADVVEYADKGTSITIGDTTINTGASAVKSTNQTFMAKTFSKLTKATVNDDLMNSATKWTYKGKEVGTYAKSTAATYSKKVESKAIYADLGLTSAKTATVYEDGAAAGTFALTETSTSKIGGNGVTLNVYTTKNSDDSIATVKIVKINTYVGKVVDIDKNDKDERVVLIDTEADKYVTEEFAEDDIVIYTKDVTASPDSIQSMAVVEKQTGKLTKLVGGSEYTIDGTAYKASAKIVDGGVSVKENVDFYLDANGYIIKIDTASDNVTVDNLAYVETVANSRGWYAVLRLADGSKKTVDLDKTTYGSFQGFIVSFKENDDGTYKLTKQSASSLSANTTVNFTNGKPMINGYTTNSKTVFVYNMDAGDTIKTYTGYKNAASITGSGNEKIVAYVKSGVAVMVYVEMNKADLATTAADLTVIAFDDGADVIDEGDGVSYYEFNAVVDGKVTTVKVDDTAALWAQLDNGKGIYVSDGLTTDSDDIATAIAVPTNTTFVTTVKAAKNDVITLGGVAKAYTDDVEVYFVDDDAEIAVGTIGSIRTDENGTVDPYGDIAYHVDKDGLVDLIVIVKK